MLPTIFFTYKTSFTTFHVDWSQKIDKNFFEPFFQKILQVIVPYGTKISIFVKSISDKFFHSQNMFHNISLWLKRKNWQKFFRTIFSKYFTSYCPPMGPKISFLKKVFPTIFFTYKTSFTTFHVDWGQKIDKNFFEPFFQKILQVIVPLWDQKFHFWKKFFRQFFSLTKQVSQHFTLIEAKKSTKIVFEPFFQKILQVIVPLWDQKFHFWKKFFRQFFSLTKQVSQHFTLIEAKKSTKIFSNHFFKKVYKLLSPYGTKISIFVKSNSDKNFLQVIVPLRDQNFNFWKKCFRQFFSLTKQVSQHFTLIEAKKSTKIVFEPFFQKILQVIVPLWDQKFHFWKKFFRQFFSLTKQVSQHFTLIEAKKSTKIFSNHFFKKVYKLLSPYGTKISIFVKSNSDKNFLQVIVPLRDQNFNFWKKCFRQFFSLTKQVSQHFTLIEAKKSTKNFLNHFFKKFYKLLSPMGPKFQFLWKVFPTNFFTHRICFTTFHFDWSEKIDKNFFEPFFQNILQVIVPLWDQKFHFWKKFFRQFFSLTKQVSQHFTLIEAKKLTKILSKHFFKKFYKLLSPYGTKNFIFEKSFSDNFFHLQNKFHNISRWLKPKNRQKFSRTIFSKYFTSYCPPMGPKISFLKKFFRQFFSLTKQVSQHFTLIEAKKSAKILSHHFFKKPTSCCPPTGPKFQFLWKVFPINFFTHRICFTTFHVDWSQKIDKNFFEPIFQNFTSYCPRMGPKFPFLKKVFPTIFFTYKTCFTTFHVDWSQKIGKNFVAPFFQKTYKLLSPYGTKISIFVKSVSDKFFHSPNMFHNISRWLKTKNRQKIFRSIFSINFTSYCPPMGPKISFLKKVFPTIFFTYKTSFTTFHVDWSQKIDKNFFEPFFQKILQVIVPLGDQKFHFWKKFFRQFFSLTKQVSQHFTLIEAKKSTKIFSNHFFKKVYKLLSPYGTKISIFVKSNSDKNFLQVIVPLRDQNFNFWKKCFRQFFSLTKQVSQHFTLIEAKKSTKIFSNHFFKKFYKLLSPYGTKSSIFVKSVSDKFFHSQNMFHNISLWLKRKNWQKFFRTIFSKYFTSYCPPMGPKISFLKKVFPTIFFTYKTSFTTFHVDWSQKIDKNFFEPFFQKILQVIVPLWDQNFNFCEKCFRQIFSLTEYVSQHFTLIEAKKLTKIFSNHFFKIFYKLLFPYGTKISIFVKSNSDKNFLQFIVPLRDQNFNFWKKCFRKFFSLTKQVSQHFTLIEAKKSTKIFSNHFFKKIYKLLSPYGTKISIFVKSVSDKFFHSQNMFHNISLWLKRKNWQKFFQTIFSKYFTSYCPPMGPKISFLKKVFPTIFFTYKTSFTTFHVDWSQKIDKNFFEPFFQKILQVIVPLWDQNFNFCEKCFRQIFSLTEYVSQHFTLMEAKKLTKIFSNHFFKIFYKLLSPYGTKISIFVKSNSDKNFLQVIVPLRDQNFNFWKKCFRQFFHLQNKFHNISRWLKPKNRQKFFRTIFSKKFYKLLSPYGTKISIFVKSVSDKFFHSQNMFHNISLWLKRKNWQKFFRTIFSKYFTSYCPPMGPKISFLKKVFPTIFFTYKTSFTTFHVDWGQKIDKNFFEPFFQKILQVIVPLWDQKFHFWKKFFRQFFSLTKQVSQHFTLIEAKKSTKIFSNHFFKIFYKLLSPYGTKNFIFEKSFFDNFFHLQNKFHNISRWLKPKNWQKFFRTIFSKKFTTYCPPMGPKFQFLEKVFPTIFFT